MKVLDAATIFVSVLQFPAHEIVVTHLAQATRILGGCILHPSLKMHCVPPISTNHQTKNRKKGYMHPGAP